MTDPMIAWLSDTLDAVDAAAREAARYGSSSNWSVLSTGVVSIGGDLLTTSHGPAARHIAFFDPAMAQRMVAATRKLMRPHTRWDNEGEWESVCFYCYQPTRAATWPCETIRIEAERWGWTGE